MRTFPLVEHGCFIAKFKANVYFMLNYQHLYHPNVMFSQVSVCPQGDVCIWSRGVAYSPRADTPQADTLQADTLGRQPPEQTPALDRHPSMQCMLGYGQQAGGTHPTGMHSCLLYGSLLYLLTRTCSQIELLERKRFFFFNLTEVLSLHLAGKL